MLENDLFEQWLDDEAARVLAKLNSEIKQMYRVINAQTWKIISVVGLIVLLGKIIENF